MKIIVNRGFSNILTRIIVFKNSQIVMVCPHKKDYCEFDAKEGDEIVVKLKSHDTIASFVYHEGNDTFYIGPTTMCRRWELANFKIFPFLSLFFIILSASIKSDAYEWFCVGTIVLLALSLLTFYSCMRNLSMQKRLFKVDNL